MKERARPEGECAWATALLLVVALLASAPLGARHEPETPRASDSKSGHRASGWVQAVFSAVLGSAIGVFFGLAVFGPAEDERTIAFQELTSLQRYLDVDMCSRPSDLEMLSKAVALYNDAQIAYRNSDFGQARYLVADAQVLSVKACKPLPGEPPFTATMDPCTIPPPGSSDICAAGELDRYWGVAPLGDWDRSLLEEIEEIFNSE